MKPTSKKPARKLALTTETIRRLKDSAASGPPRNETDATISQFPIAFC